MSNNNMSLWDRFIKSMTKANELGKEEDVMLDHDYDGIKELDNVLPPWWVYGFYITIAISIFYYVAIYVFDMYGQQDEYNAELKAFQAKVAKYKADHPEEFSTDNLIAFTDAENIGKGKSLFTAKGCVGCHRPDLGGSVGPNLTDEFWILGGDIKSVFNTITEGGRKGSAMTSYASLPREERQQLASYILSMQGTNPEGPKKPEGNKWVDGAKTDEVAPE
jgi:cytochrome c oxidase cbb3-type subunit 3